MDKTTHSNPALKFFTGIIKILLPVCFIAAGVFTFNHFKASKEKMNRKPAQKQVITVKTVSLKPGSYPAWINAMGTVAADRQVTLKAKVAGEIVSISPDFSEGSVVKKGQALIQIDDSDYKIDVGKARSALAKAMANLELEKGSQAVARQELELIQQAAGEEMPATDLSLRKPQLMQAKAEVENAQAGLDQALLNLSRTTITAPFNSIVIEKNIDAGSVVASQAALGTLVDIDRYRIAAKVPQDKLGVLAGMSRSAPRAVVQSSYSKHEWAGTMVRTTGQVNDKTRMAEAIILVADPLGLRSDRTAPEAPGTFLTPENGQVQLMLNEYVSIKIEGRTMESVYAVPSSLVRENDTLWIYSSGKLEIRQVSPVWKDDQHIFIEKGIQETDRIIVSDLPYAVNGMELNESSGDRS